MQSSKFIDLSKEKKEQIVLDKPGHYVVFMHNVSGKFTVDISSKNVEVDIFGLFVGRTGDEFKVETIQHHRAPGSVSNLLIKGVFDDNSRLDYQGLIRIEKEGQQSHAYQKNQNLILSPDCFVQSKPFLEILANDVFCTHGSTTGRLNKEDIFYVKSRGVDEEEAKKLLVAGFIGEIFEKMKEKGVETKNYLKEIELESI